MREALVERPDPHGLNSLGNQIADRIVDHRSRDSCPEAEAIGEIGGAIEFAAAHVHGKRLGLVEGHHAGIEPVNQGAKREKVQGSVRRNRERGGLLLSHEMSRAPIVPLVVRETVRRSDDTTVIVDVIDRESRRRVRVRRSC